MAALSEFEIRDVAGKVSILQAMTQRFFFRDWSRSQKVGVDEITEDAARSLHDRGELYVVMLGDRAHPACVLEVKQDYVAVEFLDEKSRSYVSYQFQRKSNGKLFLTLAVHRHFSDDTDKVESGSSFSFKEDGEVAINERNYLSGENVRTAQRVDVSSNWESPLQFGEFNSISTLERTNQERTP